jgi:hypothetical protein
MERDRRQNGYRRCICQRWRRCIVSKRLCATDSRTVIWKLPPIWRPSRQVRHFLSSWSQTQQEQVVLPWLQIKMELTSAPTIAHTIVLVETTFFTHAITRKQQFIDSSDEYTSNDELSRQMCIDGDMAYCDFFTDTDFDILLFRLCLWRWCFDRVWTRKQVSLQRSPRPILNLMVEIHIDILQISDVQVNNMYPYLRIVIILFWCACKS